MEEGPYGQQSQAPSRRSMSPPPFEGTPPATQQGGYSQMEDPQVPETSIIGTSANSGMTKKMQMQADAIEGMIGFAQMSAMDGDHEMVKSIRGIISDMSSNDLVSSMKRSYDLLAEANKAGASNQAISSLASTIGGLYGVSGKQFLDKKREFQLVQKDVMSRSGDVEHRLYKIDKESGDSLGYQNLGDSVSPKVVGGGGRGTGKGKKVLTKAEVTNEMDRKEAELGELGLTGPDLQKRLDSYYEDLTNIPVPRKDTTGKEEKNTSVIGTGPDKKKKDKGKPTTLRVTPAGELYFAKDLTEEDKNKMSHKKGSTAPTHKFGGR